MFDEPLPKQVDLRKYAAKQDRFDQDLKNTFRKSNIDFTTIHTDQDYIKPLINLFKRR